MYTQAQNALAFGIHLGISLLAATATAGCATWNSTDTDWEHNGGSFQPAFSRPVDYLPCPNNATAPCQLPRRSYNVTVNRDLSIYNSWPVVDITQVAEADSIFALAADAFYRQMGVTNTSGYEFITRSGAVSSYMLSEPSYFEADPGMGRTLLWDPFMMYSVGILGGCDNASLNGLRVTAGAGYMDLDHWNQSYVAGTWGTVLISLPTSAGVQHIAGPHTSWAMGIMSVICAVVAASAF